ncbi:TonB-dependent receptor [Salinivirga cyanobacteriivorans]
MNFKLATIYILLFSISVSALAQKESRTDANLVGHVTCCGEHIPFATILIEGTTIGTTTDETGHYRIMNMPVGEFTVTAQALGYAPKSVQIKMEAGQTKEIKFDLKKDVLNLEEVVVTGDRNKTNRRDASVIVSTISPKVFEFAQAATLSEGLDFSPGLRLENNCQNCGFTQVRMNGMEGPYSQILINSRPIFSGLAGVYGLELIPENMIERIEVVRGGGSALYGSNAIAGTINLILKDPITNSYEMDISRGSIGAGLEDANPSSDFTAKLNTSLISSDSKTGMALYGFYRKRAPFDANGDDFSELSDIKNTTIGSRMFHRFTNRNRVSFDVFHIHEKRRGGDKFNAPLHESTIAEAVEHRITTAALTYDQFFREHDKLSVFASGQKVDRDSYYGAERSMADYGYTQDFSYTTGAQYHLHLNLSEVTLGLENQGAWLKDKKLGYPDLENTEINIEGNDTTITVPHTDNVTIADQQTNTFSAFGQYDITYEKLKVTAGVRFDHYMVKDYISKADKSGNVISPRLTVKYDIFNYLQSRLSYSQGYRAPQIYDEDLHIETSTARKVLHENDPDLKQETSHSIMASLDFNKKIGNAYVGVLAEGFYTKLMDAFSNEFSDPDSTGTVTYTRVNADGGATVAGINIEVNVVPTEKLMFKGSFTYQSSKYENAQEFGETSFLRTPSDYGYLTIDYQAIKKLGFSLTGNYTGSMLVPYFGNTLPATSEGELRESNPFYDIGIKARFNWKLNGATMQFYGGVKNIFNSYQDDFDYGHDRDPGYIYGPGLPRMIYAGIKISNLIH